MEFGSIDRELYVDAAPEVVFEVISRPEHLREWWPDDASLDPMPGGVGKLVWNTEDPQSPMTVPLTVIEAVPARLFSFRWAYDPSLAPDHANSFLVTFELLPTGAGTTIRFTETGFREQGWEIAVLEAAYHEHEQAWDQFIPRLAKYVLGVAS